MWKINGEIKQVAELYRSKILKQQSLLMYLLMIISIFEVVCVCGFISMLPQ